MGEREEGEESRSGIVISKTGERKGNEKLKIFMGDLGEDNRSSGDWSGSIWNCKILKECLDAID